MCSVDAWRGCSTRQATKLGVEGTSYGGYATNLLITQTNRFAAAVNISGKVNIISFLGDSPKIGTREFSAAENGQDRIGATLWEAPLKYIEHSAVMFADRIKTPPLMLTGKEDWNVPDTNEREAWFSLTTRPARRLAVACASEPSLPPAFERRSLVHRRARPQSANSIDDGGSDQGRRCVSGVAIARSD